MTLFKAINSLSVLKCVLVKGQGMGFETKASALARVLIPVKTRKLYCLPLARNDPLTYQ